MVDPGGTDSVAVGAGAWLDVGAEAGAVGLSVVGAVGAAGAAGAGVALVV